RSSSARDCEGLRTETVGDRLGQRRIPLGSVKPKAPSTPISPTAFQGRLFVLVLAPPFRARDYLVQAPGLRSQGLRLRQRRVPEIDGVYLTWLRSSISDEDFFMRDRDGTHSRRPAVGSSRVPSWPPV